LKYLTRALKYSTRGLEEQKKNTNDKNLKKIFFFKNVEKNSQSLEVLNQSLEVLNQRP
jgi:hypothetical protein